MAIALATFLMLAGSWWMVSAPAAPPTLLVEHFANLRELDALKQATTEDIEQERFTVDPERTERARQLAERMRQQEAAVHSLQVSLVGAGLLGLAGALVTGWWTGRRRVSVRVDDAAVHIDGRRVPVAALVGVELAWRRLILHLEGESIVLVAAPGAATDLFQVEELLQQRLLSAEDQQEERAARQRVRQAHSRMMEQLKTR